VQAQAWDLASVAAILNETADLAQVRAVDLELLGALGQLIPAIYLPTDEANNAISVKFYDSVVVLADRPIVKRELTT
jgi:hypothetical protein